MSKVVITEELFLLTRQVPCIYRKLTYASDLSQLMRELLKEESKKQMYLEAIRNAEINLLNRWKTGQYPQGNNQLHLH